LKKILIAAVSKNFVLARNGKIPWYSKTELEHFKKSTIGFPVIMGRKTWQTLTQPLKARINIVLTKQSDLTVPDGLEKFSSFPDALDYINKIRKYDKCFIIGGAEIFSSSIEFADEIILSVMNFETDGDRFFPEIDFKVWREVAVQNFEEFKIHTYIRINDLKDLNC
jgi:dihydrofolate reductase